MISGADLRAARREAGFGLEDMAARAGCSAGHLSRVEKGERPVTHKLIAAYVAATGREFAAKNKPGSSGTVENVHRRDLLGLIAAASVGAAAPEPLTHLLNGLPPPELPTHVGPSEVAGVEQAVDLYTRLDLQYGGGLAAEIGRGSLRWATALIGQDMTEDTRQRLCDAVGSLADRVAWSFYDNGQHAAAFRLFTHALSTAAKGQDRDLRGHILLNLSTLTFDLGHRDDAVDILRLGLGDDRVSPVERANLHTVCARHCAGLPDGHQTGQRHLGMAQQALADADPAQPAPWARQVTAQPGHFDSALGLATFALDDFGAARTHFTKALEALGPGRVRTIVRCRTRLAVVHLQAGEVSIAEWQARTALGEGAAIRSARVRDDFKALETAATDHGQPQLAAEIRQALTPSSRK